MGVFYPFMRVHTTFGTPDQEPWSYGTFHEALNRRAIELRYELLPHIYNVMHEASLTGLPAFVTTHGGEYFFLPGLPALRYLAMLGAS